MKEHREQVKICPVQCGHLIDEYLEGVEKVKSIYHHLDFDDKLNLFRSKKLRRLAVSLGRLICSVMAAEELVRTCGGTEWKMTALAISTPSYSRCIHSRFGIYLLELYVIHHILHGVRSHTSETHPRLLCTRSNLWIEWCENEVKLVLKRRNTVIEDVDEFQNADERRQDEDRHLLLASLQKPAVRQSTHVDTLRPEFAALLMQSTRNLEHGPRLDFASLQDCYYVDHVQFDASRYLESGTYKSVRECSWLGVEVAVAVHSGGSWSEKVVCEEVKRLARVLHPSVVHLIGYAHMDNEFSEEPFEGQLKMSCPMIIMELMEGDLHGLIKHNRAFISGSPFPLPVTLDILLQIVGAMIYVHQCGVIHRDLNPKNILVQPKYTTDQFSTQSLDLDLYYTVKLTDFASANGDIPIKPLDSYDKFHTGKRGTTRYMAPEVWNTSSGEGYTSSVDVWSFGMTAYHIVTGSVPFENVRGPVSRELMRIANEGTQILFEFRDYCPVRLKNLIENCWAINPDARPSFEQIRKELWTLKKGHETNFEADFLYT